MSLKQLFISMEDEATNETELVVSADDTLEIEIADAAEAEGEVEEQGDNVEELGEISEGLESILISMESAMQDGGLNPQAALFMQHAVQAHVGRLGLEASDVTPSMESFGGASGQAAATTISMEGIGETLKKIWLAIKNAVSKAIQAIKNFFAKIFGGVSKLKTRSDALKKAVSDLTEEKGDKIKVPNANTLRYKGKADISSVIAGLEATHKIAGEHMENLSKSAAEFYAVRVPRLLERAETNDFAKAALENELLDASKQFTDVAQKTVSVTSPMSGDAVMRMEESSSVEKGTDGNLKAPKLVKGYAFKALDDSGTEVAAPSKAEMQKILGACDKMIAQLEEKKKSLEKLTEAREKAMKESEKKVEGWTKKIKESAKQAGASMIMRKANLDLGRGVNAIYSHEFNVVRAALALVDRGVAAHKAGPAKEKK
jgi:hypothetical protein